MGISGFFAEVRKLKDTRRAGWVERGVSNPESVADHSFNTAVIAFVLGSRLGLDTEKAIKMALVHDLPESRTGDRIMKEYWEQGGTVTKEEKYKEERDAIRGLGKLLGGKEGREFVSLWEEFEKGESREARLVRQADKLEMLMQGWDYYKKGNFRKDLKPFFDEKNMSYLKDKEIKSILEELMGQ